jgi:hypothetical protein
MHLPGFLRSRVAAVGVCATVFNIAGCHQPTLQAGPKSGQLTSRDSAQIYQVLAKEYSVSVDLVRKRTGGFYTHGDTAYASVQSGSVSGEIVRLERSSRGWKFVRVESGWIQ